MVRAAHFGNLVKFDPNFIIKRIQQYIFKQKHTFTLGAKPLYRKRPMLIFLYACFNFLYIYIFDSVATCRLIESSLGSVATKFNFFIHNLAQLRFSGLPASDEPILTFSPKTFTLRQDGRIASASIFSFQKRYNPDKHYVSCEASSSEAASRPTPG